MKYKILVPLMAVSLNAVAAQNSFELQSCDVHSQHAVDGQTGGKISDIGQAHISVRANVLSADISTTRKARKFTQVEAERLYNSVESIRHRNDRFVEQQGFLSSAEKAGFDREFDAIAVQLCK